jgi:hypothetical protein
VWGGIALPRRRRGIVVTGVPDEQEQRLVVVPAHPPGPRDPGDSVRFELRQLTDETPALPAFSTVAGLVRELGPYQPWVRVPLRAAREAAAQAGVRSVVLDPALETGAWRWDAERMAGLSARVHAGEPR